MINKELQDNLKKFPDDYQVWMPSYNGHVETYGVVDDVSEHRYESIQNDFFGTPGRMDKRLFDKQLDGKNVLLISSDFGLIPNKEIDFGDDDINDDIRTINGSDGDKHLLWHLNDFEIETDYNNGEYVFIRRFGNNAYVKYNTQSSVISIYNPDIHFLLTAKLIGIEDIRNACELGKVPFRLII